MEKSPTLEVKESPINNLTQLIIGEAEKIQILPENLNIEGKLLAANGQISKLQNELHWKMVRTDAFKNWFGDWQNDPGQASKIVDENNEPLIVYHSSFSSDGRIELDPSKGDLLNNEMGKGAYFSPYLGVSRTYGDGTYFCFLNIKKPIKAGDSKMYSDGIHLRDPDIVADYKNMAITMMLSILRPKNIGLVNKINNSSYKSAEKYSEIVEFDPEDIMIIPSPTIGLNNKDSSNEIDKNKTIPGHGYLEH